MADHKGYCQICGALAYECSLPSIPSAARRHRAEHHPGYVGKIRYSHLPPGGEHPRDATAYIEIVGGRWRAIFRGRQVGPPQEDRDVAERSLEGARAAAPDLVLAPCGTGTQIAILIGHDGDLSKIRRMSERGRKLLAPVEIARSSLMSVPASDLRIDAVYALHAKEQADRLASAVRGKGLAEAAAAVKKLREQLWAECKARTKYAGGPIYDGAMEGAGFLPRDRENLASDGSAALLIAARELAKLRADG